MSYQIDANYNVQFLFPHSLDDYIPKNHPARFIREFVDSLDLEKLGFIAHEGKNGRPFYGPRLLLNILIYGNLNHIKSSRDLEIACANDLGMIWLVGEIKPDYTTISRFIKQNRKVLKKIFKNSVLIAADMGLISFTLQAIDGTKIIADCNQKKDIHRADF